MSKTFDTTKEIDARAVADALAAVRASVKVRGVDGTAALVVVHVRTVQRWNDGENEPMPFVARRILAALKS